MNHDPIMTGLDAGQLLSRLSDSSPAASQAPVLYSRFDLGPASWPNAALDSGTAPAPIAITFDGRYDDSECNVIAPYIDAVFYLPAAGEPDGFDPVLHYSRSGWREGRDPNTWFNTSYYLDANPDVRSAAINPLWHYLVAGHKEGRRPARRADARRDALDEIRGGGEPEAFAVTMPHETALTADMLAALLSKRLARSAGLVIAASHDRYVDNIGGTQIFVALEHAKFAAAGCAYLHISPVIARTVLAPEGQPLSLQIVLDGSFLGHCDAAVLSGSLRSIGRKKAPFRLFVVHSLLGHDIPALVDIARSAGSSENVFWLHDFFSVCAGYDLLRNGIAFCGAPPADSLACRVCVHGTSRHQHLAAVRALFDQLSFKVVAPSQAALDIWLSASDLPNAGTLVREHARLGPPLMDAGGREGPLRIAFVGNPVFRKGYPFFHQAVRAMANDGGFHFFHFMTNPQMAPLFGVTPVSVAVTPDYPSAMIDALTDHDIDLVVVASPWPETFSFVTYEAMAAGADVIALADGGNVPVAVIKHRRGMVLRDETALIAAFINGQIAAYGRQMRAAARGRHRLIMDGTTAAVACLPVPRRVPARKTRKTPSSGTKSGGPVGSIADHLLSV